MNKDLRNAAVQAVANYMHYELLEITGDAQMLPWVKDKAEELIEGIDRAVAATKNHPLASQVKQR